MTKLLCPDCGHDVWLHGKWRIGPPGRKTGGGYCSVDGCDICENSPQECVDKISAAQRAAAIAHLRALGKSYLGYKRLKMDWHEQNAVAKIYIAIAAYRAVFILKERKP